jgi:hypothetical protein
MTIMENIMMGQISASGYTLQPNMINMLQCIVSSGADCYGLHDDKSTLLNHDPLFGEDEDKSFETCNNHVLLPDPIHQQTITLVLCEGSRNDSHVINWMYGEPCNEASGQISVGHNTIHIQAQGSQFGLKHTVSYKNSSVRKPPKWRMVLSGRLCGNLRNIKDPKKFLDQRLKFSSITQELGKSQYQCRNVFNIFDPTGPTEYSEKSNNILPKLNILMGIVQPSEEEDDPSEEGPGKKTKPSAVLEEEQPESDQSTVQKIKKPDTFPQISGKRYKYYKIKRPLINIRLGSTAAEVLSSANVAYLMKKNFNLVLTLQYIMEDGVKDCDVFLLENQPNGQKRLHIPGERIDLMNLSIQNGIL